MIGWIVGNALAVFVGYSICLLFPVPKLSRWILDRWAALWAWVSGRQ